jgi:hypothetical protein
MTYRVLLTRYHIVLSWEPKIKHQGGGGYIAAAVQVTLLLHREKEEIVKLS